MTASPAVACIGAHRQNEKNYRPGNWSIVFYLFRLYSIPCPDKRESVFSYKPFPTG
jgi:hypothetical protein